MRIWSIHPKYLDPQGLVALWRESLLAQAVLRGRTRGYTRHPQLMRFREGKAPLALIAGYLRLVQLEAARRGYNFDARKISRASTTARIPVTRAQLDFEWRHLLAKLRRRNPELWRRLRSVSRPQAHRLFRATRGEIAGWERLARS